MARYLDEKNIYVEIDPSDAFFGVDIGDDSWKYVVVSITPKSKAESDMITPFEEEFCQILWERNIPDFLGLVSHEYINYMMYKRFINLVFKINFDLDYSIFQGYLATLFNRYFPVKASVENPHINYKDKMNSFFGFPCGIEGKKFSMVISSFERETNLSLKLSLFDENFEKELTADRFGNIVVSIDIKQLQNFWREDWFDFVLDLIFLNSRNDVSEIIFSEETESLEDQKTIIKELFRKLEEEIDFDTGIYTYEGDRISRQLEKMLDKSKEEVLKYYFDTGKYIFLADKLIRQPDNVYFIFKNMKSIDILPTIKEFQSLARDYLVPVMLAEEEELSYQSALFLESETLPNIISGVLGQETEVLRRRATLKRKISRSVV